MEIPQGWKGWVNAVVVVAVAGFFIATAINYFPVLSPLARGFTRTGGGQ